VFTPAMRRASPVGLALLITMYGGLVRLDAIVERYGQVDHPGWARVLTHAAPRWAAVVKPEAHRWDRIANPYTGGDPINYLRFAREMRTFYQPHVREPLFLAWTKAFLWLLSDQDVAISFASAASSTVAIFGVYLLTAALASPAAGVAAALLLACEYDLITWGIDGWRDDTFMATVVFAAWAFVRLQRNPTFATGLLAGLTAGLACLTRITALSFLLPALLLVVVDAPHVAWRQRATMAALAAVICGALVGPFLISCAIAMGDPFYAINYHTGYYRFGEGLPSSQPMNTAAYLGAKFASHPVRVLDTVLTGLFVQPFATRFHGYEGYAPHIGAVVQWCAAAGLMMLPFVRAGRMVIVILVSSLLPYAFTWNVSGGGEWRFTMHAYPLYIAAALFAIERASRLLLRVWQTRRWPVPPRAAAIRIGVVVLVGGVAWAVYTALPWFVVRESITRREDVSIETGPRDRVFFAAGWSAPHDDGVPVRISVGERATVRFPLPARRDYEVVVRLDPVVPDTLRRLTVLLNRQLVGAVYLRADPSRMGAYRLRLPREQVTIGINELTIVPDTLVTAAAAGPKFEWLDSAARPGVRLWYVRVLGDPNP
jgi:4-amino-4-deoxy-L-arabinose transferase-like glycosyltransferase